MTILPIARDGVGTKTNGHNLDELIVASKPVATRGVHRNFIAVNGLELAGKRTPTHGKEIITK